MSEPTSYTILAVTERFVLGRDDTGRRDRIERRGARPELTKGQVLTAAEWAALSLPESDGSRAA